MCIRDSENTVYPVESLMNMYYKSVGRKATLIVGLTPDTTGLIPSGDVQRLKEWGDEINRRFSSPLASTSGQKKSLTLKLDKAQPVNHCIIQENIRNGERLRQYKVEDVYKRQVIRNMNYYPTSKMSIRLPKITTATIRQPTIRMITSFRNVLSFRKKTVTINTATCATVTASCITQQRIWKTAH